MSYETVLLSTARSAGPAGALARKEAVLPRDIIDERTLAGYLIGPTEQRAREVALGGAQALIRFADIEEHVVDPTSRATLRCDLTLRSHRRPLVSAELKRPEVMAPPTRSWSRMPTVRR